MKERLFRSEVFEKYSDVIRERNAVGITIVFSVYISVMLLRGLILGLFFGTLGIDRYYKGDIGLGILKFLSMFILIGFIWYFIDLFVVYKGIQKDNFKKLNMALSMC